MRIDARFLDLGKTNVLKIDNEAEYTPTEAYHPATKHYVDTKVIEATSADAVQYGLKFKQVGEDWYLARTVDGADEQLLLVPDEMTGGDTSGQITQAIEAHVSALHTWNGTATEALAPIYVSGTGNDETGDGTEAKPYRQISKAVSMVQPYNKTAAEIYVGAGTYREFTVDGHREISLVFTTADTTIAPVNADTDAITVKQLSALDISTTASGTSSIVRVKDCNRFINVENARVTVREKVRFHNYSGNAGGTPLSGFVRAAENAYFDFRGYSITASGLQKSITTPLFHCDASRMVLKPSAALSITRKSNTSWVFMIFMLAENGGNIYLDGTNTTINAEVRTGLSADTGGIIAYSTITNNATTPTKTANGGRILTGAE